jgi:hypothetical protein
MYCESLVYSMNIFLTVFLLAHIPTIDRGLSATSARTFGSVSKCPLLACMEVAH